MKKSDLPVFMVTLSAFATLAALFFWFPILWDANYHHPERVQLYTILLIAVPLLLWCVTLMTFAPRKPASWQQTSQVQDSWSDVWKAMRGRPQSKRRRR